MSTDKPLPSLMIATPARSGVATHYARMLVEFERELNARGVVHTFAFVEACSDLAHARNRLAGDFLETGLDACLMIDSDISISFDVLRRMLESGKDFVTVACVMSHMIGDPPRYSMNMSIPLPPPPLVDGLIKMEKMGAVACTVIRQKVITDILTADAGGKLRYRHDKLFYGVFDPLMDEPEHRLPEDIAFCYRWRQTGGDIFVMPDADVRHGDVCINLAKQLAGAGIQELDRNRNRAVGPLHSTAQPPPNRHQRRANGSARP